MEYEWHEIYVTKKKINLRLRIVSNPASIYEKTNVCQFLDEIFFFPVFIWLFWVWFFDGHLFAGSLQNTNNIHPNPALPHTWKCSYNVCLNVIATAGSNF